MFNLTIGFVDTDKSETAKVFKNIDSAASLKLITEYLSNAAISVMNISCVDVILQGQLRQAQLQMQQAQMKKN